MDKLLNSAKALIAAAVAFLSTLAAAHFGFEIPADLQVWVVSLIVGAVSGALTWLVPNKAIKVIAFVALLPLVAGGLQACKFSDHCDAECVAEYVEDGCNVAPNVADIATVLNVPGAPAGKVLAKYICDQWRTAEATVEASVIPAQSSECVAIVNGKCCIAVVEGVCIERAD